MKRITKFYRLQPLAGLLLAAPAFLSILWISTNAYTRIESYRQSVKSPEPWSRELLSVGLHDELQQTKRFLKTRLSESLWPVDKHIPLLEVEVKPRDVALLKTDFQKDVKAYLWSEEKGFEVKLHPIGKKHWHRIGAKPSLGIDLKRGDLVHGLRYLRLLNPHRPLLMRDALFLDLAHETGLLSTRIRFVWLRVNGQDLGVYTLTHRPEERGLRQAQRFPAHIYSVDHLSEKQQKQAWQDASAWEQIGEVLTQESRLDLQSLLSWIQEKDLTKSLAYAHDEINVEAFARLAALNILFGEENFQNFDLYFDPYRGQWEPVVFSSDGFHHAPVLQSHEHPLFKALERSPRYLHLRHEALKALLVKASSAQVKARLQDSIKALTPALQSDFNWHAKNQWASVNSFRHQLMRPMQLSTLNKVLEQQMFDYTSRETWLKAYLKNEKLPVYQPSAASTPVTIGPGDVYISHNKVFGPEQTVTVLAGTRLLMGPKASLVFRGPLHVNGTSEQPVTVQSKDPQQAWGGIVLQGQQTASSQIRYLTVMGGTSPQWKHVSYPGTLNIHHTQNIELSHVNLKGNKNADDYLHMAYVKAVKASHLDIQDSFSDAVDLEFCDAKFDNVRVRRAGDDSIDLMGTHLDVRNSQLLGAKGNGISAGEESHVKALALVVAHADTGVLSKHASSVKISQSLLLRNQVGWEVHQFSPHYMGDSTLQAADVLRWENKKDQNLDKRSLPHVRDIRPRKNLAEAKDLPSASTFEAFITKASTH